MPRSDARNRRTVRWLLGTGLVAASLTGSGHASADDRPPGPTTTGVPPGVQLQPSGPVTATTRGQVLEGLDVRGCIEVRADDVVIRNSRIRCDREPGARAAYGIEVVSPARGTLVEDVEISGGGDPWVMGVMGSRVTVRRAWIHGVGDGIKANSHSTYDSNYIHDLAAGEEQHNDGIQMSGGHDVLIRHNRIVRPATQTSAILLKADREVIADVRIVGNWLDGGNFTVYVTGRGPAGRSGGSATPNATRDVVIRDNRFGSGARHGIVQVRHVDGFVWRGNTWDDTGAPVPAPDDGRVLVEAAPAMPAALPDATSSVGEHGPGTEGAHDSAATGPSAEGRGLGRTVGETEANARTAPRRARDAALLAGGGAILALAVLWGRRRRPPGDAGGVSR